MRTYVATHNRGKLAELQAIFAGSALELEAYPSYGDVTEDVWSFEANALLKARALQTQLRADGVTAAVLADDSGLEVDALGGRPGVLSARYAGEETSWPRRRHVLLAEMNGVPDERRGARFVCVIVLIPPNGQRSVGRGVVAGRIAREVRGAQGFGYDPIFVPDGETQTFAEMREEKKNSLSHRRAAAAALLEIINREIT